MIDRHEDLVPKYWATVEGRLSVETSAGRGQEVKKGLVPTDQMMTKH
jgi:hypothetical protein